MSPLGEPTADRSCCRPVVLGAVQQGGKRPRGDAQRMLSSKIYGVAQYGRSTVTCSERRAGGSTPSLKDLFLYVSSQENPVKKSGEKTETFSASALAVGTPKACYPSSTQPGPEGVPSQIRAVDRPDSWSLGRLHPPLDGSPTQYICLSFWIFGSSG